MDFQYSSEVPRGTYRDDDLAGGLPLREHNDTVKEVQGTLKAQADWNEHISPVHNYYGGLGDRFTFMRVIMPECMPERLEVLSYANEYAWLYDDQMEKLDLKNFQEGRDDMLRVFESEALEESVSHATPEKRLQAKFFKEMLAIDRPCAITAMEAWAKFIQLSSRGRSNSDFRTLAEYLPHRVIDAGELFFYAILTFAMGLTIPTDHVEACHRLARPGYKAIALVNDVYSWPKERRLADVAGEETLFTSIWIIMNEQGCDEATALSICKAEIKRQVEELKANLEEAKRLQMPKDAIAYLEAVQFCHVGNLVWSIYCPRYNAVANSMAP